MLRYLGVFQLKLIHYSISELHQELNKTRQPLKRSLALMDEIYRHYASEKKQTEMTMMRFERYELLKKHFTVFNVLVPANHYQGKDFFESKEREFIDKHVQMLCEIKNENPEHKYPEILGYYRRILFFHLKLERLLGSIKNKLNSKNLDLFILMTLSHNFYQLFEFLTKLIKIMKEMKVAQALIKKYDVRDDELLDLVDSMIEKNVFKKILILSKITQKKDFEILLSRPPLKDLIAQNQEIDYLKMIK